MRKSPCKKVKVLRYSSCVAQTVTDFDDASHSESTKSVTTTVSYGIFRSENSYPCTVTVLQILQVRFGVLAIF